MRTLVIGLGNPILGDDAVGCRVAQLVEETLKSQRIEGVDVEQFYRGGIALMERLIGYDQALIIDSIHGFGGEPGSIHSLKLQDLPTLTADSPHDTSLKSAIELGNKLGAELPKTVDIIAVEIRSALEFSETLTAPVEACIPEMVRLVLEWIEKTWNKA
jgi:hydrogenase maturation protease